MLARVLAAALAIGACAGSALADEQQDRLKRLLDEKFGSMQGGGGATRGLPAPRQERSIGKDDIYIIKPDGSVNGTGNDGGGSAPADVAPGKRSSLPTPLVATGHRLAATGFAAASDGAARPIASDAPGMRLAQAPPPAARQEASPEPDPAKRERFMARRNTFVVQLKPDATSEQIDDLIKTYNLNVVRSVSSLGVLYVQVNRPPPTPEQREKWRATRSLPKPQKDTLSSVFEPKVIVEMRKHPAVDAAFVDSTIRPRTLPRTSGSKVQTPDQTFVWSWANDVGHDGNWGLKTIRMPAVWTILDRFRKANPDKSRTRVSFLDSGFGANKQVVFKDVWGGMPPAPPQVDCGKSHGTHVAGIVGAMFGKGTGIDGVVPDARLEAVPITRELLADSFSDGVTDQAQQHVSFFMDAIADLAEFLDQFPVKPDERRVVNISLAYNWAGVALASKSDPTADKVIRDQVRQHAKVVQTVVNRFQDRILFIAAAGNDSDGLKTPVTSEFATPFAYAGTHIASGFKSSPNILVVEAQDRNGRRASFSNIGGHVAAPGVDIMSTFASDKVPFGVCSGTSQAAPHVSGLAAILFELDPTKTPAEIADIIRSSAVPPTDGNGAPMIDALAAVLKLKDSARYLADLNGDGKVDIADLELFKAQMVTIENAKYGAQPIEQDLNGDGVIDGAERCWPRIDLNGSGRASYDLSDVRTILGQPRSDLDMMRLAWTDTTKTFDDAMKETGLDQLLAVWQSTAIIAAVPEDRGETDPCR